MTAITLWHASRADIDRPTLAGRTTGEHHDNSGLGLFCATSPQAYIAGFGPYVFELVLIESPRIKHMTIDEFSFLSRNAGATRKDFEELGLQWAKEFDCLAIVEVDGQIQQMVVLSDQAIAQVVRHEAQDFLAFALRPTRLRGPG